MLLLVPGTKNIFDTAARDGFDEEGRELVVWLSVDGTIGDLIQALITYDP
jgi:hypothetical protein